MKLKRSRLYKVVTLALSLALSLALLEGLCSAFALWKYGTVNVVELNELQEGNTYVHQMKGETFATMVQPHPWLGIVPHESFRERMNGPADFPLERDPSKFTILLTGGSVAQLLGMANENGQRVLELALNRLDFGGREVVVLNAATGATRQPRQVIALMLYSDICDAVLNLDGFNESKRCGQKSGQGMEYTRMEHPGLWFFDMNPVASEGYDCIGASWQATQLRTFSDRHNSRLVFFITNALRAQFAAKAGEATSEFYDAMFEVPSDWSEEKVVAFNVAQYQKYLRTMHAISDSCHIREAHFIQPCPAVGKVLTEDEKRVVGELSYAAAYEAMTEKLLSLRAESVPVVSLLNLYSDVSETIYKDRVHCGPQTRGYPLMAERIARELSLLWGVPLRGEAGRRD